jgi:hypothetical protein
VNPLRIIVPLLAAAVGAFGGYALMHGVAPGTKTDATRTDSAGVPVQQTPSGPPPELKGGDPKSMLRPEQMRRALAIMEREGGGPGARVEYIRLAPGRINTDIAGDGKRIDLYLAPDGRLYSRSESSSGASSPDDDIAVGKIPAGAPWRIVRNLRESAGLTPDDIDYMLIQREPISEKFQWLVYLKGVNRSYYRAALNGAHPTRCC